MARSRIVVSGQAGAQQEALVAAAERHGKAVVTGPVYDTMKEVRDGVVVATLDRDTLRWPVAWAYGPGDEPPSDPPPAAWFVGAAVVE